MGKRWCICFLLSLVLLLLGFGSVNFIIDPMFHYRKPMDSLAYMIYMDRYQNDGIGKHFDYDGLITGSSMTENFKTSEMDALFGTKSVKVAFPGASYRELGENLGRALKANPKLKTVVWGLDYNNFFADYDAMSYEDYPTYLYDNNPLNDVNYLFNKEILIKNSYMNVLIYTKEGGVTTDFDSYANWNDKFDYGKEEVLATVIRPERQEDKADAPFDSRNIEINVLSLAEKYPDVDFYLFWTPYSIVWFDYYNQNGELKNILKWEKEALELMLPYENIRFYSFNDDFDITTNLDYYKDIVHYSEDINSYILKCMAENEHRLTLDNYGEYWEKEWDFYTNYDYDSIYA